MSDYSNYEFYSNSKHGCHNDLTDPQWDALRQFKVVCKNNKTHKKDAKNTVWLRNLDETTIPYYIAMFTKGMLHNSAGRLANLSSYQLLIGGLATRNIDLISSVPLAGTRKFVQPIMQFSVNLVGQSPSGISLPASPSMSSAESAGEMVELYSQALARDVPYDTYSDSAIITNAIGYLNALSDYTGPKPVTAANIFRGLGVGDLTGPYLSQAFFIDDIPSWPQTLAAKFLFPTRSDTNNRMITQPNYIAVQNGTVPESDPTLQVLPTYPNTGRDLTYIVWKDDPSNLYITAVRGLLKLGAPFNPKNPYRNAPLNQNQGAAFIWSMTDLITCMQIGSQTSLLGAWYAKWSVNRRLRPEAFGNEVEQYRLTSDNPANINSDLLTSGVLADVFAIQGNHYLSQAYPEGSPLHPSYPAGHAVFSGFSVTIIKAFMDESWVFPNPVQPTTDGTALDPVVATLTLGGEMNKMASNVSLGRDWAGIHYRSDGHEGILLGEKHAIVVLQDWVNRYAEPDSSFCFHGYLGNEIVIEPTSKYGQDIQNP